MLRTDYRDNACIGIALIVRKERKKNSAKNTEDLAVGMRQRYRVAGFFATISILVR